MVPASAPCTVNFWVGSVPSAGLTVSWSVGGGIGMPFALLPFPPSLPPVPVLKHTPVHPFPPSLPVPGLCESFELEHAPTTPAPTSPVTNTIVGIVRRIHTLYRETIVPPTRDRHRYCPI